MTAAIYHIATWSRGQLACFISTRSQVRILPPLQYKKRFKLLIMNNMQTMEQQTAQAILEQPVLIVAGGQSFEVSPPTLKTLILASEAISTFPNMAIDKDNVVESALHVAKDSGVIGTVLAILILGSKHLVEQRTITEEVEKEVEQVEYNRYLWGLIERPVIVKRTVKEQVERVIEVDRKKEVADFLLENCGNTELHALFARLITGFQLADFFGLTTFLTEINMLRPTKVVEN